MLARRRFRFSSDRQKNAALIGATAMLWWAAGAWELFPLGWLALTPFFLLVSGKSARQRFSFGYVAGFFAFWWIHWWLVPTITRGSVVIGVPVPVGFGLSLLAVTLIALISALAPGITALAAVGRAWWVPVAVASVWVAGDVARIATPLAHSWGALGYSQTTDPWLLASAFWLGQHGLTWICVFIAACLALWWRTRARCFVLMPLAVLLGAHALGAARWATASPSASGSLRVVIVQTGVASVSTGVGGPGESAAVQALRLTRKALDNSERPDLVVWPETTMHLTSPRPGVFLGLDEALWREARLDVPLLTGARVNAAREGVFNAALLFVPDAMAAQSYFKTHLVPFGERPPFVEVFPWLAAFAPRPLLEPGDGARLLHLSGGERVRPAICFESCFPLQTRVNGKMADLLVVTTNDEWFAGTEAPRQHRAMGRLRAAESGVPLVQACNGAFAFAADARGALLATTRSDEPDVLTVEVPVSRSPARMEASGATTRP